MPSIITAEVIIFPESPSNSQRNSAFPVLARQWPRRFWLYSLSSLSAAAFSSPCPQLCNCQRNKRLVQWKGDVYSTSILEVKTNDPEGSLKIPGPILNHPYLVQKGMTDQGSCSSLEAAHEQDTCSPEALKMAGLLCMHVLYSGCFWAVLTVKRTTWHDVTYICLNMNVDAPQKTTALGSQRFQYSSERSRWDHSPLWENLQSHTHKSCPEVRDKGWETGWW